MRDAGLDFDESKDYDWIKGEGENFYYHYRSIDYIGYASYYLAKMMQKAYIAQIRQKHETDDLADASLYRQLADIDTGLRIKVSDQLFVCLRLTSRPEFIKVSI